MKRSQSVFRKSLCIFLIGSSVLAFTGCSSADIAELKAIGETVVAETEAYINSQYDDDELIATQELMSIQNISEKTEGNRYSCEYKLIGVKTLWTIELKEAQELEMPYRLDVANGTAKLVLVYEDNSVVTLLERTNKAKPSSKDEMITLPLKAGINTLKVVAKDKAKLKIEIEATSGTYRLATE